MSDDIVELLERYARTLGGPPEDYLTWQAAAEIKRLRAARFCPRKDCPLHLFEINVP